MSVQGDELLYLSIQAILKSWTALQLAVKNSFGGPDSAEKAQWLVGVLREFFAENRDLQVYEVEEYLGEIVNQEFNMVLEDGSVAQVAKELYVAHGLWEQNKHQELREKIQSLPQANTGDSMCSEVNTVDENIEINDSISNMEIINVSENVSDNLRSKTKAVPDEDGWTTVPTRRKK